MKKIFIIIYIILIFSFNTTTNNEKIVINKEKEIIMDNYGFIKIDKIKLNRTFKLNGNIDKEIVALPETIFPSEKNMNSMIILAAHSGTSKTSYFNYLYKLKKNDNIEITYQNDKYIYKIIDIYHQNKNGKIKIPNNINKKMLILTTCTNNNKKYQTIYISTLTE